MGKDEVNRGVLCVVSLTVLVLLLPQARAQADELSDLKQQVADLQKRAAQAPQLEAIKKQLAEVQKKLDQLEVRQRRNEESLAVQTKASGTGRIEPAPTDFRAYWKDGLRFATRDKNFELKVGGRLQNDWLWIGEDRSIKADVGNQEDGTEFRRARLYISGLIYGNVEFKAQYDFAGGDVAFKDMYVGLRDLPFGSIRAGHFKEPFGLEELTSSKYITFLERALPDELEPSRNVGVMLHGTALEAPEPRMTWAAGVFRDTPDSGVIRSDGGYNFTGRLTWLPWYENKGASLLHLGGAYSHRNPNGHTASYSARPEAHLADRFVNTGSFTTNDIDLFGLETACVSGPFSVQGEYTVAEAHVASRATFQGYYAQASYFLTGEHRQYKPSEGAFTRVKPKANFNHGGGSGAWEVALRYSGLDLNDDNISGGVLHDTTAGLNWYLNPNTRVSWNYVHADKHQVGDANMLMMRLQIDF
jgi:phosphate-selective porin OprO and OprP